MQRASVAQQGERTDVMADAPVAAAIPREMRDNPAWVVWRYEPSPSNPDKPTKVPYSAHTGEMASSTDPSTWATFKAALLFHVDHDWTDGIGMVVCDADDFVGIDLDHCLDPETGVIEPWAQRVVDTVNSYTEVTPSGAGLRIFARGTLPPSGRKKGDFEIYENGRYLTVTGRHLDGTPLTVEPRELEIRRVHRDVWPDVGKPQPADRPTPQPTNLADSELLEKAHGAENGTKFSQLWSGNATGYPSHSEADLALCNLLAFWTGADPGRMDSLFRASGLFRPKWDERHYGGGQTYGDHTIEEALSGATEFYKPLLVGRSLGRIGMNGSASATGGDAEEALTIRAFTDSGNAERLADQYGHIIRFCHPWGVWLAWDGQRWKRDEMGTVENMSKRVARSIYAEMTNAETKEERATIYKHAVKSESAAGRAAMIRWARAEDGIPILPEQMDRDPWLLNVMNGTIDLRTGDLRPHNQADSITKLAPVHYDREAKCPIFLEFLKRVLPDREVRRFLRYMAGYGLTGATTEQCLAFLYGGGANGKSTFLDVMQDMLGDYAQTAAPDLLTSRGGDRHPTELADLFGARWVSSIEVDEGKRLAETLVKQMTGGDKMKARFMRTDFFQWTPTHKLFLAANHKPEIRGTDYAIWRRIKMIPFTVTIPEDERDGKLGEKLRAELPGILNWAIDGCLDWQQHGLGVPQVIRDATDEYRQEQDILATFVNEKCIADPQAWVASGVLYAVYAAWCKNGGEEPISNTAFGKRLTERGFFAGQRPSGERIRTGIRLLGSDEQR
jgi:putative DNA primase/helicase